MDMLKLKLYAGVAIAGVLIAGTFFSGGYFAGKKSEQLAQAEADRKELVESITWVRGRELELQKESTNASSNFEKQIAALNVDANAAKSELGRLRVKARTCTSGMPTHSSAGQSEATSQTTANGLATGEINLDDAATSIIQLGYDLDAANAQIVGLQKIVNLCERNGVK